LGRIKFAAVLSLVLLLLLVGYLIWQARNKKTGGVSGALLFYCAAGVKPPVEMVAADYEEEYGLDINLQYGGSGTLLSNLRVARKGDLFLAADESYVAIAREQGLVHESIQLAKMKPVIATRRDGDLQITAIEDLMREDLRVAIANPDAASIGRVTKRIFEDVNVWGKLKEKVAVFKPTVTDVANDIKVGSVDVGIIWDATANHYPEIRAIRLPVFDRYQETITAGVLTSADDPTSALTFLRFLSARDRGLLKFQEFGYSVVEGDRWEERPNLLLYSGGVNRVAIEETIERFERREGVEVTRIYNGCGILVSQMKAGGRPDAYFACDLSFMTEVDSLFEESIIISQTPMVILVQKGNPKEIKTLRSLAGENLKLGIANHQQSALGALTKRLLEKMAIWEDVLKNVRSQTPTADLLVNQIRTGSLDAVVVYEANTVNVKDQLEVIQIDHSEAEAIQPFAVGKEGAHKYLTERLLAAIISEESKDRFEAKGFNWRVEK
jgi:molybdenum ABC transporter molybdate-binding protein